MFYFIWKASFLWEHNNDLLIYKVLYFKGSQNSFFTIVMPWISNTLLEHKKAPSEKAWAFLSVSPQLPWESHRSLEEALIFPFGKWLVGLFNY